MVRRIVVLLLLSCSVFAADVVEGDFFTDTIGSVDQTVDITDAPYNADGSDAGDDSTAVQNAIDAMTALPNGGKVIIPAGTFHLIDVVVKSNVHLEIDSGARLVPAASNGTLFFFGLDNDGGNALVTVTNASIRGAGGRYTVDFHEIAPNPNKMKFVTFWNTENFMVSDFLILDNLTKMSSLTFNSADYGGQWFLPRNGVIKNGHVEDAHYGYGLIQAQVCTNVLFKDLSGDGGITLRLETGAVDFHAPAHIQLDQIYGRNISIYNGHGGVMCGPHTRDNGHVDIDGVTAVASLYAASAGDGYVTDAEAAAGETPGSFADTSIIKNVHAVYGENAGLKTKNFDDIPCELRHLISAGPKYSGKIYNGPSATVAKDTSTDVTITNVTQEGFVYQPNAIIYTKTPFSSCSSVPVAGVTLSETTLQMNVAKSAALTATVSPAHASDPAVTWRSDNPSVAIVGVNGAIMAVADGTATITAVTRDGTYVDSCSVRVSGGGGGSWAELLRDDFESGWGNWESGWANWADTDSDAVLINENAVGSQCVYLIGDVSNSVISLSAPLDLTGYSNLKIEFSYMAENFASSQDFWVQYSDNNGVSWKMIDTCVAGKDFGNSVRTNAIFIIDREQYSFTSEAKLRIGCDKENGGDDLFVDEVVVSVFEQSGWGDYVSEHDLSGAINDDADGDGQPDVIEYALGGNAGNDGITGVLPATTLLNGTIRYFHEQLTNSNSGVVYMPEWTEDLVGGPWTNAWDSTLSGSSTNAGFEKMEYQLDWAARTSLFFRLRISQP